MVVTGTQGTLTPRTSLPAFNDLLSPEDDLDNLRDGISASPKTPVTESLPDHGIPTSGDSSTSSGRTGSPENRSVIKIAARTVMCQLVDRLGHFPMGWGAAQVNSTVQEFHDLVDLQAEEFTSDLFSSPNLQVSGYIYIYVLLCIINSAFSLFFCKIHICL